MSKFICSQVGKILGRQNVFGAAVRSMVVEALIFVLNMNSNIIIAGDKFLVLKWSVRPRVKALLVRILLLIDLIIKRV